MAPFVFTIIILILGMKAPPFRDGDEMPPSAVNRRQSPSIAVIRPGRSEGTSCGQAGGMVWSPQEQTLERLWKERLWKG